MAKKKAKKKARVSPIPKGYHAVQVMINCVDATAQVDFCKKVFGAKLRMRMDGPDKKMIHGEIEIGDCVVMLADAVREPPRTADLMVYVPDVDKVIAKAVKAGATVINPAMDMFWGDRFGRVKDPQGNGWGIATHVEDVAPAEQKKRAKAFAAKMAAGGG